MLVLNQYICQPFNIHYQKNIQYLLHILIPPSTSPNPMSNSLATQFQDSFKLINAFINCSLENSLPNNSRLEGKNQNDSRLTICQSKAQKSMLCEDLNTFEVQKTEDDQKQMKMPRQDIKKPVFFGLITSIEFQKHAENPKRHLLENRNSTISILVGIPIQKLKSCLSQVYFQGHIEFRPIENIIDEKQLILIELTTLDEDELKTFNRCLDQIADHCCCYSKKSNQRYGVTKVLQISTKIIFKKTIEFEALEELLCALRLNVKKSQNVMEFKNIVEAAYGILLIDSLGFSINLDIITIISDKLPTQVAIYEMVKNCQCYSLASIGFDRVKKFTLSGYVDRSHVQFRILLTYQNGDKSLIRLEHAWAVGQFLSMFG